MKRITPNTTVWTIFNNRTQLTNDYWTIQTISIILGWERPPCSLMADPALLLVSWWSGFTLKASGGRSFAKSHRPHETWIQWPALSIESFPIRQWSTPSNKTGKDHLQSHIVVFVMVTNNSGNRREHTLVLIISRSMTGNRRSTCWRTAYPPVDVNVGQYFPRGPIYHLYCVRL